MSGAAAAGWRAVAPDLAGFGDSEPNPPGTWERHVETLDRFVNELDLGPIALVVHDWGGLIGLRWACDHPDQVRALVISNTGFFEDGRWHGFAKVLRTEGEGEAAIVAMSRDLLAAGLQGQCPAIDDATVDEFAKCLDGDERRQGHLELYRSGDFSKLGAYRGKLGALGVPTLLLWGAADEFAPVGGAYRFRKEISHAELVVVEGAGHFLPEEDPERMRSEIERFLGSVG